jgi:hypothetical protein
MKEEYLHFIFDKKMLGASFKTTRGATLSILDFGELNVNAGPDFLDCQIALDGQKWAGPIEFHVKSSDWFRHGHQDDPAYRNVIAHFVFEDDHQVISGGYALPTVELKHQIDWKHYQNFQMIQSSIQPIPCEKQIRLISKDTVEAELETQIAKRLWDKSVEVLRLLERFNGDRDKLLRVLMGRVFGGKVNQIPFERLSEQLSHQQLRRLKSDTFALEAYLFGLAGFLDGDSQNDAYTNKLKEEFNFLQKLFGLTTSNKLGWKYSRMRPSGFPDIRIAQFASLLTRLDSMPNLIQDKFDLDAFMRWASFELPTYWWSRYRLGGQLKKKQSKSLSSSFLHSILINAIVPYLFAIGLLEGRNDLRNRVSSILKALPPEKNRITKQWSALDQTIQSAYHSQGYLALLKQGCNQKKCLLCRIGKDVMKL